MTTSPIPSKRDESEAIQLLAEQVFSLSGYDFRDYSTAHLRRRLTAVVSAENAGSLERLRMRAVAEPQVLRKLVAALSKQPGGFFKEPLAYRAMRQSVFPSLRTYPSIRVWLAGCGAGEEAYALAAALLEEGLLPRCRIYATDLCPDSIAAAKTSTYPAASAAAAAEPYARAGGRGRWGDHYKVKGSTAVFDPCLRERILFSEHSLATDASFNEFHLAFCRGLLPLFNRALQARVHRLIYASLCPLGVLALGSADEMRECPPALSYTPLESEAGLFRKAR